MLFTLQIFINRDHHMSHDAYHPGLYDIDALLQKFYRDGAIMDIGVFADLPYLSVLVGVTRQLNNAGWNLLLNWPHKYGNGVAIDTHDFGSYFAVHRTPYSLLDDCAVLAK